MGPRARIMTGTLSVNETTSYIALLICFTLESRTDSSQHNGGEICLDWSDILIRLLPPLQGSYFPPKHLALHVLFVLVPFVRKHLECLFTSSYHWLRVIFPSE